MNYQNQYLHSRFNQDILTRNTTQISLYCLNNQSAYHCHTKYFSNWHLHSRCFDPNASAGALRGLLSFVLIIRMDIIIIQYFFSNWYLHSLFFFNLNVSASALTSLHVVASAEKCRYYSFSVSNSTFRPDVSMKAVSATLLAIFLSVV